PTELGMVVTDLLLQSFDDIFEVKYTARMEEELDEIEDGKLDWRAAMSEFYEKFDRDLKHAEEHMTDIKRMEKPTDEICPKCGKPLVIKWGQHGSFFACTGYPDFSVRSAEATLEGLQRDIAKRAERARKRLDGVAERRMKYEKDLADVDSRLADGRITAPKAKVRKQQIRKQYMAALEKIETEVADQRRSDREAIELRLKNIETQYPNIRAAYDLDLNAKDATLVFTWRRKDDLCTYTRELPVDLPDVDKVDLSEQGDEEYCENCGRPMVLKKGRFGTFYACTGDPDCKTTKPIGGQQKKSDVPLDEKCPQCGNNLVLKYGRYGEFTACSNYPACK